MVDALWFLLMDIVFVGCFLVHVFDLPDSSLLAFAYFRETFSHNNHIWEGMLACRVVLVFFKCSMRCLVQIVRKHRVVEINELAEMAVCNESLVGLSEVRCPRKFKSHHFELMSSCSSWSWNVIIEFDVFDVEHYKLSQTFSWAYWCELLLIVGGTINLESTHGMDVYHVHKCWNFVD